jgi:glycosyltransferase involved in cell wall biosynthesis
LENSGLSGNRPDGTKRIAFLLPNLRGGGAERVAVNLARSFLDRGFAVDMVLACAEGELLPLLPSEVTVVDLKAKRFRSALLPLARYLRQRRPDALQARMWPLTVIAILARRLARVSTRLVVSDHIALSRQYGHAATTFAVLKATTRWLYPSADVRLLVSEGAADDLAALSGLPRDSLEVVYNLIPPLPAPSPAAQGEADALWASDGAVRIISVGTLKHQKNHALLIRAFALLRREQRARLMIVGEGECRGELIALAAAEGVADDVLLPGFRREPWPLVATADLFVLSSDYEGFGNVLIEAMRLGVRVVTTNCPSGPAEIIDHGRYGQLVPPQDAAALAEGMKRALAADHDPELLRRRADTISGSTVVDRYLELLLGRKS